MINKSIITLGLAGILLVQTAVPALAQSPSSLQNAHQETREQVQNAREENQAIREETRTQIQENREAAVEQRCSLATQRIDLWTTRYANNQSRFQRTQDRIDEVIERVIERAQASGKDTAELEAALSEMQGKVDQVSAEYEKLISLLNDTKQYACGESEGAFRDALRAAQDQLLVVRDLSLETRLYYQQVVRPAAQALLSQE